uniref:C-type lectin domain-containing protein n=1 Tax=Acrobeloides nanus TaxID=290746 RepID=A0A914CP39_9BILA
MLSLLILLLAIFANNGDACPNNGEFGIQASFYSNYYNCTPKDYKTASSICPSYATQPTMGTIPDVFSNANILEQIKNVSDCPDFYIGFTYSDNKWSWADGSTFGYLNWEIGYPTNTSNACATIKKSNGKWENHDCSVKKCFICSWFDFD